MPYYIYKLITQLVRPFIFLYILRRVSKGKEDKTRISERYGISNLERKDGKVIWFHAASIGESLSILPLLKKLNSDKSIQQIIITTGTLTSANILKNKLTKKIIHQYIPFDIPVYVNKFLDYWKPSVSVFVESEIWPNFLYELKRRNIHSLIVNGRMTIKSYNRWSFFGQASKGVFSNFAACCTQNSDSTFFYKKLGIKNTIHTGNLKFAYQPGEIITDELKKLKPFTRKRKIFLAASTHPGEEEMIKNITLNLKKSIKNILTIIVPRHVNRESFFSSSKGLGLSIRSKKQSINNRTYLYLADTVGELNMFYSIANIVFIGGSLVPHGGQNPIEAAYLGKKIYHGKNIENFSDVYSVLKQLKFTQLVENERQLEYYVKDVLTKPQSINKDININRLKKEGNATVDKVMEVIYQYL
tara:strand:- start:1905 stop:3149 length:1245 start_codon:yes stop_codon:yes gene_type:complete